MILGIDLGTTYSVCAYLDDKGNPQVIENFEGEKLTPSVVQIEDGNVIVGEIAKDNSIIDAKNVISTVKNYMGNKHEFVLSSGEVHTPESISSFILKKLVIVASKKLETEIKDVVITVPAYFTDAQREATRQAAQLAGLNLVGCIEEPTAAALCYVHENEIKNGNFIIYDLGGGTFDVTVVTINNSAIEVRGKDGLSHAGGRFFDEEIVKYVCEYMNEKHGINLKDEKYREDLQELYLKAEKCKLQLSGKEKSEISIKIDGVRENVVITREFFESKVQVFYKRSESKMKSALRGAGMRLDEIDQIMLVGGSSKIPYITKKLKEYFGKEPSRQIHPDEAVAKGAALYSNYVRNESDNQKDVARFSDISSHSIGLITVDRERKKKVNTILIRRNTKLPATLSAQKFRTFGDNNGTINLTITEGEFEEIEDVTILCDFPIKLPSNIPKDTSVEIQINLDVEQNIHIFVNIPLVQLHEEFQFDRLGNLSDEDVEALSGLVMDKEVE